MRNIKVTNNKGEADEFIKKVIKTFKCVKMNGHLPTRWSLTGFILNPKKNRVTLYAGYKGEQYENPYHLENNKLVEGEDGNSN